MRLIDADTCPCNGCINPCLRPERCENFNRWFTSKPANPPLTLEELRGMDGEPVWVDFITEKKIRYWGFHMSNYVLCYSPILGECLVFYDFSYGKEWVAYRKRPEEVK